MPEAESLIRESRGRVKFTLRERFDQKWTPEPNSGCHLWTASVCGNGYGTIKVGGKMGDTVAAHRLSWEFHNGPIPAGMCVLHQCDTPLCVNPAHLFLGTKQDNSDDAKRKGRTALFNTFRGEAQVAAKLTEALVIEILTSQESRTVIANRMGVGASNVKKIRARKIWTHVVLTNEQEALRMRRRRCFDPGRN